MKTIASTVFAFNANIACTQVTPIAKERAGKDHAQTKIEGLPALIVEGLGGVTLVTLQKPIRILVQDWTRRTKVCPHSTRRKGAPNSVAAV